MDKQEFIKQIAAYVKKYASSYNIKVYSPIIAQAILESAYGTSELAVNAYNYFGLKYRAGRCKTCIGIYNKVGSEQNADGSYTSSSMQWCKFKDMENGVIGYFDFTNISNYANLKGVTDPRQYLENIKADGYATSLKYVDNLMSVIEQWGLTQYDNAKEEVNMSNSPLVTYTNISKNKNSPRNHAIDTITIHCIVGQWTAKQGCDYFATTGRECSANYVVGKDGSIGLSVDEKDRSWCSSNAANDHRAITIEVASDTTHPYAVTDKAYAALLDLVTDICKRNGIKQLLWKGDKSLIGQVDKQNMTVHRWFANKACPGDYLYNKHSEIAAEVNRRLGNAGGTSTPTNPSTPSTPSSGGLSAGTKLTLKNTPLYVSSTTKNKSSSKTGTFYVWSNAVVNGRIRITNKTSNVGVSGQVTGWIDVEDAQSSAGASGGTSAFTPYLVKVTTSVLNIRKGAGTNYGTNGAIRDKGTYTIVAEADGQGASKWGKLKSGAGWISLDYTKKV